VTPAAATRGRGPGPGLRARARRLRFGLSTLLGLAPRGVFIPYRYAGALPPAGRRDAYPAAAAQLAAARDGLLGTLARIDAHAGALKAIAPDAEPPAPRWNQDWFPGLDAAAAYALVRDRKPARVLEVGSGHSTRFLSKALADAGTGGRLHCIDPAPRARLDGLPVRFDRRTLQAAGPEVAADLGPGDLLFVDSSHVLVPGSDVDLIFGAILPRLPAGALLHVHDVFLPDDYPAHWAWRGYNEQSAVMALLAGGWRVVWASHYVRTRLSEQLSDRVAGRLPMRPGALESSLWLEKTAPAA
jgi:predicted O-methyltransferase YrrM